MQNALPTDLQDLVHQKSQHAQVACPGLGHLQIDQSAFPIDPQG